jgi:hypothetical protein
MPGLGWFPGTTVNDAESAPRCLPGEETSAAGLLRDEVPTGPPGLDLQVQVGGVAPRLRDMGVAQGDRVAPYLANVPEATASLVAARVSPRFSSTPMITAAAHAPSTDGSWFARSGAGCPRLGIWWCCRTCLRVRLARLWEPACGMN